LISFVWRQLEFAFFGALTLVGALFIFHRKIFIFLGEKKMKKTFDYQNLYLKQYKNIPNMYFWGTLLILGLGSIVTGIIILATANYDDEVTMGLVILIVGSLVAWGLAYLSRFIASVAISQKVVVADTLLSMSGGTTAPTVEDELPEL